MSERLQFGENEAAYSVMDAAEHLSRYLLLRDVCAGKQVLDIACGEGYGAHLLAQWGAASVTAIDVSAEAIEKAKRIFPSDKVVHLVGDALSLDEMIPTGSKFDLICSFETIEHLSDPKRFVELLAEARAADGIVAISAPNDMILPPGVTNPYHLQRFDLAKFKALTETALGPATFWLLGAPFQGYTLVAEGEDTASNETMDMRSALRMREQGKLNLVPPVATNIPKPDNSHFWVGVWGALEGRSSVAAAQSMTSWQAPWQALDYFKQELENRAKALADHQAETRRLGFVLAEERCASGPLRTRVEELETQLENSAKALADHKAEIRRLGLVLAEERRASGSFRTRVGELETQLAALKTFGDQDFIKAIARETVREQRRRRVVAKLRRWIKRAFVRDTNR